MSDIYQDCATHHILCNNIYRIWGNDWNVQVEIGGWHGNRNSSARN